MTEKIFYKGPFYVAGIVPAFVIINFFSDKISPETPYWAKIGLGFCCTAVGAVPLIMGVGTGEAFYEWTERRAKKKEQLLAERMRIVSSGFGDIADMLQDGGMTIGGRQLIAARFLNLKNASVDPGAIKEEVDGLYARVKKVEKALKGTPTFGAEFHIDSEEVARFNPAYDFNSGISLTNQLKGASGGKEIRGCHVSSGTVEFRINPSYAPITIALMKEMLKLGAVPRNVIASYSVCMDGNGVLDNGLALIVTNFYTGLTPNLPSCNEGEFTFRDVHIYHGATVDVLTGKQLPGTPQLNIFAGATSVVENNPGLEKYKSELEQDVDVRFIRMLLPFLMGRRRRKKWNREILEVASLTSEAVKMLESKLIEAENAGKVWATKKDIKVVDSAETRQRIDRINSELLAELESRNPGLYSLLTDTRL